MAKRIRPIALALIEHEGHIFVSRGKDPTTRETFHRFLGGGIEFGEASAAAVARELAEEIQATLVGIEYITCLDNIFTYNDKPKHELIQLFRAQFSQEKFYALNKTFELVEGEHTAQAFWIETARVLSGELKLVPESCLKYLTS